MKLSYDPDRLQLQLAAARAFIETLDLAARDVQYGGIFIDRRYGRDVVSVVIMKRDRHGHPRVDRLGGVATRTRRFPIRRLSTQQHNALDRIREIL